MPTLITKGSTLLLVAANIAVSNRKWLFGICQYYQGPAYESEPGDGLSSYGSEQNQRGCINVGHKNTGSCLNSSRPVLPALSGSSLPGLQVVPTGDFTHSLVPPLTIQLQIRAKPTIQTNWDVFRVT